MAETVELKSNAKIKRRLKIATIIILLIALVYCVGTYSLVSILEGRFFARTDLATDGLSLETFGTYEEVKAKNPKMTRRTIAFSGDRATLRGYDYGFDLAEKKGLFILCHGFSSNQMAYLYMASYLVDQGYEVLTYDNTGTVRSDGKDMVDLYHSSADLRYCLKYVDENEHYDGLDYYLLGHSWGAYAVTDVFNYDDIPPVKGVIALSAFDYSPQMALEFGVATGVAPTALLNLVYPAMWAYEYFKGGNDAMTRAHVGVNKATDTKFCIVHGTDDDLIPYDRVSLFAQKGKVTNPNAEFVSVEGYDHNHMMVTKAAWDYDDEIEEQYDEIMENYSGEEAVAKVKELNDSVDHAKINEINTELYDSLLAKLA